MASPNEIIWVYGVMLSDSDALKVHTEACKVCCEASCLEADDPFNMGIEHGPLSKIRGWLGLFADGNYYGLPADYCDVPSRERQKGLDYAFGVEVKSGPGSPIDTAIVDDVSALLIPFLSGLGIIGSVGVHKIEQYG